MGSNYGDETKIASIGLQGKSSSNCFAKTEPIINQKKRSELLHIRLISKHTNIDTLFDSGSQDNLISEKIIKNYCLETKPHPKPYPLSWFCENSQQVTKQCRLKFAITSSFMDEVVLDVSPLDIYGIVLGSPYLYDMKAIFYREENKYHLFKDGA